MRTVQIFQVSLAWLKKAVAWLAQVKALPETAQQTVHFFLPLISFLIFYRAHIGAPWTDVLAGFWLIVSVLIETLFDPIEEHDPFWPKGFRDTAFYWAGTILGFVLTL